MKIPFETVLDRLIEALADGGEIRAYGGMVCGFSDNRAITNATELKRAIDLLHTKGIHVDRMDSGGSPRWAITSIDS